MIPAQDGTRQTAGEHRQARRPSLGEAVEELSALAAGLGLVTFVAFPFTIPFLALTAAFTAPVLVVMLAGAVLATPPVLIGSMIARRRAARRRRHTPGSSRVVGGEASNPTLDRRFAMARIEGVSRKQASPMTKIVYRLGPRMTKKLTGREPQTGTGLEPITVWAHSPKMMVAMGKFNGPMRKGKTVSHRIQNLVELKGSAMIGCEFCVDLGSQICRNSGFTDDELLAIPNYRSSELFSDEEKAALDFAVGFMRTPLEITDEVFANAQKYFTDRQLVELAGFLTVVNLNRFNAAFGIGSAGFSEGRVCVRPDRPAEVHALQPVAH